MPLWCWAGGLRYSKHSAEGAPTHHLVNTRGYTQKSTHRTGQSAQQLNLMCDTQAQAHLNNRNCTVRIGCKKKKKWEEVEGGMVVQWWKEEEEEGSRHLLFEGLVFDSLGKAPETSSPPLWPSIKGEAVKDCAKRIALHQRNWKKKTCCQRKTFGPNQVKAPRSPSGGQRQYWFWPAYLL